VSESEVIETLRGAAPEISEALAGEAIVKLTEPDVERGIEHDLQRFAELLERNPRLMKRFVNAYSVERAVRVLEGNFVESGPLVLWTILRNRWPELANYLESRPEALKFVEPNARLPNDVPGELGVLLASPDVVRVVGYEEGGPLTPELVELCCGPGRQQRSKPTRQSRPG